MGWLHNDDVYMEVFHGENGKPSTTTLVLPSVEQAAQRIAPFFEPYPLIKGAFRLKSREVFMSPIEGPMKKYKSVEEYSVDLASSLLQGSYCENWKTGVFQDNCCSISSYSKDPIIGRLVLAILGIAAP